MNDLHWALAILGALFLAGLGVREWRRSRGTDANVPPVTPAMPSEPPAFVDPPRLTELSGMRREPQIAEFDVGIDPPVVEAMQDLPGEPAGEDYGTPDDTAASAPPPEPIRVSIAHEEAVDVPGATTVVVPEDAKPIRWPPEQLPDRVLGLRVIASSGMFGGKPVRQALLAAGLRHGPQQIFHKTDMDGNVIASVANLVRPGSLIPEVMDSHEYRGLSLFAVLPGPRSAEQMLEGLVQLARQLASRLGGAVQDEHGRELDAARLAELRRAVVSRGPADGDGAGA